MPKPKRVQATSRVEVWVPTKVYAQVQLKLYSELEDKVPYGAISKYINELIRKDLEKDDEAFLEKISNIG